jgi:hypothetical protein
VLRALDDRFFLQLILFNLGLVALRQGDYEEARSLCSEALTISQQMDDRRCMVTSAEELALIIGLTGDASRAARLLGTSEMLREQMGLVVQPTDMADYQRLLAAIRARVDEETFAAAWAVGKGMSLEQLIDEVQKP